MKKELMLLSNAQSPTRFSLRFSCATFMIYISTNVNRRPINRFSTPGALPIISCHTIQLPMKEEKGFGMRESNHNAEIAEQPLL
jgi:hypothetical protein